jgi:hypothetical protein
MDRLMQRVINGQLNDDETKNKSIKEQEYELNKKRFLAAIKEQEDELNKKRFLAAINEIEWRAIRTGDRFLDRNQVALIFMKHGVKFEGGNLFKD